MKCILCKKKKDFLLQSGHDDKPFAFHEQVAYMLRRNCNYCNYAETYIFKYELELFSNCKFSLPIADGWDFNFVHFCQRKLTLINKP